jgi:hypothetical protein
LSALRWVGVVRAHPIDCRRGVQPRQTKVMARLELRVRVRLRRTREWFDASHILMHQRLSLIAMSGRPRHQGTVPSSSSIYAVEIVTAGVPNKD